MKSFKALALSLLIDFSRLAMTAAPMPPKIQPMSQQVSQTEFSKIHSPNNTNDEQAQYLNDSSNTMLNMTSEHIYASGSPGVEKDTHNTSMPVIQYGKAPLPPPPLPQSMKPSWPGIQHPNGNIKAQIPKIPRAAKSSY